MSERLRVVLEFDDGGFVKGVEANNSRLKKFGKNIMAVNDRLREAEKHTGSWGRKLKDTAVTLASLHYLIPNLTNVLFGWQRSLISANAELEQSVAIMKNFSSEVTQAGAELEANNFVDQITKKASAAPFSVEALTDSMVKLRVSGIDNVNDGFNALTDSVAAFGGTDVTLKRASVAIQQMGGKGVVSMEELRQQLGEAVPNAISLMARGLGTTYQKLVKEISKGNVTSDIAISAMMQEMELAMGGSAARMMETWNGLIAQMKTQATVLARTVGDEGYFDAIKGELEKLVDFMSTNEMKGLAADLGKSLAALIKTFGEVIRWIYENIDAIKALAAGWVAYQVLVVKGMAAYRAVTSSTVAHIISRYMALKDAQSAIAKNQASINRVTKKHAEAVKLESIELGKRKKLTTALTKAELAEIRTRTASTMALKQKAIAARATTVALNGLKLAAATAAPLLAVMAAGMIANWVANRNEIQKNIDKLIEYNGVYATTEQLSAARERLKELKQEAKAIDSLSEKRQQLANKEAAYKAAPAYNPLGGGSGASRVALSLEIENLREEIAEIEKLPEQIQKLEKSIENGVESLGRSMAESLQNQVTERFNDAIFQAQREYDNARKALQERLDSDSIKEEEAKAKRLQIMEDYARVQLGEWQTLLAEKQRELFELNIDTNADREKVIATEATVEYLKNMVQKTRKALINPDISFLEDALGIKSNDADAKVSNTIFDSVMKKLNALKGQAKELEMEFKGVDGGAFEEFWLSLGKSADLDKVKALKSEFKQVFEEIDGFKDANKTVDSYDKFIAKLGEVEQASRAAFNEKSSDSLNLSTKNATKYQITMQGLIKDINEYVAVKDKERAAEMISALEAGKSIAQMQDMSALYSEITNKNLKLEEQLGKQSEGQGAYYDGLIANAEQMLSVLDKNTEGYNKTADALRKYIENLKEMKALKGESKSIILEHIKDWGDLEKAVGGVQTNALDGFVDVFTNGLTGASSGFKEFADSIIKDITRMIVKFMVMKAITGIMGGFGGGASGGIDSSMGDGITTMNLGAGQPVYSAKGNIVGKHGAAPLRLKEYAMGGVANSPQLSIFGEGSRPEAYVPLPDGRTIPVTMKGGSGNVQVNIFNQGGQRMEGESNTRFDGEKMVVDVMLKHINQPGRVRESIRSV